MNYLLESTVCITIFYGLYYLIFRRLTFVRLNRIYLLSSLVIGLSLPLISYQVKEVVKIPATVEYEETSSIPLRINSSTPLLSKELIEEPFDWNMVLQGIYVLGILFMLIKFSIIIHKLLKIKRLSSESDFISTKSQYANSSFFNLIFIDDTNLSENEIIQILEHEKWHIRLFHSYDLLFVEILKIIFWFNPILWLYQRSLSEVHEYEVDTCMIQTHNPQTYAQLLLKLATSNSQLATTHQFSRKPLTDRIHFLFTKQKSVPMKRLAYLSVLPILGAFFMAFSVEKVVDYQEVEESSKYFKIVRGETISIKESNMSKLAILHLKKDEVELMIGSDRLSKESIIDAMSYFKNYGFSLDIIDYKLDKINQLTNIRLVLLEDNREQKPKNRDILYGLYNDGLKLDFKEFKISSKNDKGLCLLIRADKKTGEHSVTFANIPPTPSTSPNPPKVPLAPPKPPLPSKVKSGFGTKLVRDSIKLIGEGELGKNPLVFINGKSYPSDILYRLNPSKISNSTTCKSEGVLKKFGVENPDGAIEINTLNKSEKDLYISQKQLDIAVENEKKRRDARTSGKSLTRVTIRDFKGREKDEVMVYKNGRHRASVTVSKGGQVFFQVGNVIKTEDEMKEIESQLLGGNCSASEDKKEIAKLGIKINNKPIEGIMKFNQ